MERAIPTAFTTTIILLLFCRISSAGPTWVMKSPMQQSRSNSTSVVLNGSIYAIGGFVGGHSGTASVEAYDPVADSWSYRDSISNPVWGLSAAVVNGKIYAFGGATNPGGNSTMFKTVEEYDPAADNWTVKSSMSEEKYRMAIGVHDNKIYIVSGHSLGGPVATVEAYDPATDTWQLKTPMPVLRYSDHSVTRGDNVYLFGEPGEPTYAYDMDADSWSIDPMPSTGYVGLPATAVFNDHIYTFGGNLPGQVPTDDVLMYEPSANSWVPQTPLLTGVWLGPTASVIGNKVYVLGGHTSTAQSSTFVQEGTVVPVPSAFMLGCIGLAVFNWSLRRLRAR